MNLKFWVENDIHLQGIYDISFIVQDCFWLISHTNYWTKIKIFALRFGMAAALGGAAVAERWWTDGRRSDCSSLLEGIEEIFSGRTQVTSPCWLLQADAATLRRGGGGGGALLPPSPQLMEIISPISAGRCQNGKIMSSSRATIHYLNCLVVGILRWNFQKENRKVWKKEKKILINWIFWCSDSDFFTEFFLSLIKNKQSRLIQNWWPGVFIQFQIVLHRLPVTKACYDDSHASLFGF